MKTSTFVFILIHLVLAALPVVFWRLGGSSTISAFDMILWMGNAGAQGFLLCSDIDRVTIHRALVLGAKCEAYLKEQNEKLKKELQKQ